MLRFVSLQVRGMGNRKNALLLWLERALNSLVQINELFSKIYVIEKMKL